MPAGASAEDSALANEARREAILALASLPHRQRQVLPGGTRQVLGLTAAADDRTFAVAVPAGKNRKTAPSSPTRFYLVKFNPVTRAVKITPIRELRVPRDAAFHGMALSPSGAKLAINYNPYVSRKTKITDVLKVMDLATGTIRTWTSAAGIMLASANPLDLSWANDNATLGFNWDGFASAPERTLPTSGFWLLDTAKPGGDLIADSRRVLSYYVGSPDIRFRATAPVQRCGCG